MSADVDGVEEDMDAMDGDLQDVMSSDSGPSSEVVTPFSGGSGRGEDSEEDNLVLTLESPSSSEDESDGSGRKSLSLESTSSSDAGGRDQTLSAASRRSKYAHEDETSPTWPKHRKHVFILSSSGKPIFSRYGDEYKLAPFMAMLAAIVSFVANESNEDEIQHIAAGEHIFSFYMQGPLYYVCVTRSKEPPAHVRTLLEMVHLVIVSVMTRGYITTLFKERPQFDLRRMIGGKEQWLEMMINGSDEGDMAVVFGAADCMRLSPAARAGIAEALLMTRAEKTIFAVAISGSQLVTIIRPKTKTLHPRDLSLLVNVVNCRPGPTFTELVCLPHFNDTGHVHVHVYKGHPHLTLVTVTIAGGSDEEKYALLEAAFEEIKNSPYLEALEDTVTHPYSAGDLPNISAVMHFVYASSVTLQLTRPSMDGLYASPRERRRLFRLYQKVQTEVKSVAAGVQVVYQVSRSESVLAWVSSGFELYVVFGPLIPKAVAITHCNRLLRWITAEDASLFVLNSLVW